jgi:hypothetical protein
MTHDKIDEITEKTVKQIFKKPHRNARKLFNHFNISVPNEMHQVDLLYLPNDDGYKYALCLVDCASRYKAARALESKLAVDIIQALENIYDKDVHLKLPKKLNCDRGAEFDNVKVKAWCKKNGIELVLNEPSFHLAFVERFNKSLAEAIFEKQTLAELKTGKQNKDWIRVLPDIVKKLNATKTRMIKMKPIDAIQMDDVPQPEDKFVEKDTKMFYKEGTQVRRLLNKDEVLNTVDGTIKAQKKRVTDPIWSIQDYTVVEIIRPTPTSIYLHRIKDNSTSKIFPHCYTYWQLQEI